MTVSLAAASMNPSVSPTTFNVSTAHKKNETASTAINIGNLQQESSIISVSDQGATASGAVSTTFTSAAGDVASLSETFSNFIDQALTQFQLYDSSGTIVADNQGTAAQQAAYTNWVSGTLALNNDTYTAIATPDNAIGGSNVSITSTAQQGTSLSVNSQLTGSDTSEYYNFSLAGGNIKMDFNAGASTPSTRVQVYNSTGGLIADSAGNSYQKQAYAKLTSGTGLSESSGNYSVKVSYSANADTTQPIKYDFQLYSGTNYAVVYNTKATAPAADYTAAGSVTADSQAKAYSRQAYNAIGATAASAINIGWIQQDKSSLNVLSQLTSADNADYYSFTLQSGDNLKFGFDSAKTKNSAAFNVQIMNSTGTYVIADNQGTAAQQAAYKSLTTTNGLAAKAGDYVVKISYATNAAKTTTQYAFNIFSGTTYSAQYKTIASAQTYSNAMASGSLSKGNSNAAAMASYLSSQNTSGDVLSTISSFV